MDILRNPVFVVILVYAVIGLFIGAFVMVEDAFGEKMVFGSKTGKLSIKDVLLDICFTLILLFVFAIMWPVEVIDRIKGFKGMNRH